MSSDFTGAAKTANLFLDYPQLMSQAIKSLSDTIEPSKQDGMFTPGYHLPEFDSGVRKFAEVATARWLEAGDYKGRRLSILDLTGNPGSNTEKTVAATLMVARTVEYIRRTGESVTIFTPTSANKGTALRDAVLRALQAGLADPHQLRIVTLVPKASLPKLRESELSQDDTLRALNPVLIYTGSEPEGVKPLGKQFADRYRDEFLASQKSNFWYSLEYRNYVIADTLRAFFEHAVAPLDGDEMRRMHVHAVSSAYGLLGYHSGCEVLESAGLAEVGKRPQSFMVQHLSTPYMVLHYLNRDFSRDNIPRYDFNPQTGLYHQIGDNPNFPQTCIEPDEQIDPTFYTHCPVTSPAMNEVIDRFGGGGIVVSLPECMGRYPLIRAQLGEAGYSLPADMRKLREWSTVMGFTGVLNAIDRGLIAEDTHVVVTGSGTYTTTDFEPLGAEHVTFVETVEDVAQALLGKA